MLRSEIRSEQDSLTLKHPTMMLTITHNDDQNAEDDLDNYDNGDREKSKQDCPALLQDRPQSLYYSFLQSLGSQISNWILDRMRSWQVLVTTVRPKGQSR